MDRSTVAASHRFDIVQILAVYRSWPFNGRGGTLSIDASGTCEGLVVAAYRETVSSLYDSEKNRLFGSEHYNSGRQVVKPSPWSEGDFEQKMAMLLRWANALNASVPTFAEAQTLLEAEDSVMGRVIRLSKVSQGQ